MASGRYTRLDVRRSSSNYCSTVTVVVFVALCLIGVWMMTSSYMSPSQNIVVPQGKQKTEVKQDVVKGNSESNTKQFEDNAGDLPEDATKGDSNTSVSEDDKNNNENTSASEENQEEKTNEGLGEESKTDDTNKGEAENEEKGTKEADSKKESEEGSVESKPESDEENKSEENPSETNDDKKEDGRIEEKVDENQDKDSDESGSKEDGQAKEEGSKEVYPSGAQSELLKETTTQIGAFSTQADESKNEKEAQKSSKPKQQEAFAWKLCKTTAGSDYIPCLDNWDAIHHLRSTKHYEHRERHCPAEPPTCLVPLPEGYRRPVT